MNFTRLSIVVSGDAPPSEFRIFTAGEVDTTKGQFVFDEEAARAVMADYQAHGVDLMIDYDHASLSTGQSPDPAQAGKAAGWFNLEVRNGELWAVNVRWTPPAAGALERKEWRFMSPAFQTEGDRIVSLLNVAITNMPATRKLQPLMAAAKSQERTMADSGKGGLTLDQLLKIAKTLGMDPTTTSASDLMAKLAGSAPADAAPADDAPAPAPETNDASAAPPPPAKKDDAPPAADDGDDPDPSSRKMKAASRVVEELARRSDDLEKREAKLAADLAAFEATDRRKLVAELVKLGVEIPATAWSDDKGTVPCKRLAAEPLDELRARVAALSATRKPATPARPPVPGASPQSGGQAEQTFETRLGPMTLSASELRICAEYGTKPEIYAENKAIKLNAAKRAE